jgi:hypothetical protein
VPPITAAFKRLNPAYKVIVGLVAPIGTIVGMLLALNIINPVGDDALAASVEKTSATTAAIAMSFDGAGRSFDAKGDVDYTTGWTRFHYDVPGGTADVLQHRNDVYLNIHRPELGDKPWIHADLATAHDDMAAYAKATGAKAPPASIASLTDLDFTDPSQALARLRHATDVKKAGDETIFGIPTHRYHAVVEPRDANGTKLDVTAWIDDNQLIRRLRLKAPSGDAPFTATLDFLKFGEELDIRPPRPAQVIELEKLLFNLPQS